MKQCVFDLCLSLRRGFNWVLKTMANVTFLGECYIFQWRKLHFLQFLLHEQEVKNFLIAENVFSTTQKCNIHPKM